MAKRKCAVVLVLLCLCLCLPITALAANNDIALDKECILTITYGHEDSFFADKTVKLYRVADVSADFQYTLTAEFAPSNLVLNGIKTQGEWDVVRSTLESYILGNRIAPTEEVTTNEAGVAWFTQLTPGLYFAAPVEVVEGELTCCFASALVALPGLQAGRWQYQVAVSAKPEILPPIDPDEKLEFTIVKLWKGVGDEDSPQAVEVEIFRNEESYALVTLSAENDWFYTWSAPDDGAAWNVLERNVPEGYTMTVEQRDNVFLVTNTKPGQPTPPPQTGDTTNILLYIILMYISGTMLIILAIAGKRKDNEKTK